MRFFIAIVAAGALAWFAHSDPAGAQARHHTKHPKARITVAPRYIQLPPGYTPGGPNYTACDRINHDRMLVGTCR
jgi:hypothetical protein